MVYGHRCLGEGQLIDIHPEAEETESTTKDVDPKVGTSDLQFATKFQMPITLQIIKIIKPTG